jgi:hypothetical protein
MSAAFLLVPLALQMSWTQLPGHEVRWTTFPDQKPVREPRWGDRLADLERHLPAKYKRQFHADDPIAHAHETTHGINAHLRILHFDTGLRRNAFYVGGHRAALIVEPNIRLDQVAEMVPKDLRGHRFELYLVKQREDWNAEPLYLFDEWVAYVNGAEAGIELANAKKYRPARSDPIHALLEMSVYAGYVAMAVAKYDRSYDARQLNQFLAWNLRRSLATYKAGCRIAAFDWDEDEYLRAIQYDATAAPFRQFLRERFGARYVREILGVD